MTKYKVGDVAALFSKPKNPTTAGGKKLQSLFDDYYSKKSNPAFHSQMEKNNKNKEIAEVNDHSVSKKSKKRKFSCTVDSEADEDVVSSKKFKETVEERSFKSNENKKQKLKKQKDFPRKNKQSKGSSFNFNLTFPKFESKDASENDVESPSASKLSSMPKNNKQIKGFIKKSKKKSLENNNSGELSNDISSKDYNDSGDEDLLRNEIKEIMQHNSAKKELEKSNDNITQGKGKTFNKKKQHNIEKLKKNFLTNESTFPQKQVASFEQNVKSKKKNRKNNGSQDLPRTKKETETNSFNFGNTKSKTEYDVENSPSKNMNSVVQDNMKKSKKFKRELHNTQTNNSSTSENNTEINAPKTKEIVDFIRKPKNTKENTIFDKDNFNNFNDTASDNLFGKNEEFNNDIQQEKQKNKFEVKAPDFIKLHTSTKFNKVDTEERLSRTLFVGNLPSSISKSELKHFFARFGAVEHVRLPGIETNKAKVFGKNPPKLLHPNYASDSIPAFITFKDKKCAEEALKLSGSIFKGHHITVDFALQPGSHKLYDDKRSIFIGNLPFDVKDESVWNAFNQCGKIENVRVVRDRQTGLGKGFGYVLFSTVEAKDNALARKDLKIEGREIRIKPVDSSKKPQKSNPAPPRRDTFKSRAIRMKKNNKATSGHKSIRKLTNKQKFLHTKKKTAAILQKAMK